MLKRFNITITNNKPTCAELAGYELPPFSRGQEDDVEILFEINDAWKSIPFNTGIAPVTFASGYYKARERYEFTKQDLIDLVQSLKDYTYESGGVLGYDEREASEFVDTFLNGRNRTPIAIEVEMEYYYKDCIQFNDTDARWIECYKSRFDELKKLTMIETKEVPKLNPDGTVKGRWVYE